MSNEEFAKKSAEKAKEAEEKLKEQKKLLANGELIHSYPHSWRSKAPLVHRATPQWFISMEKNDLRKKALASIDATKFFPPQGDMV